LGREGDDSFELGVLPDVVLLSWLLVVDASSKLVIDELFCNLEPLPMRKVDDLSEVGKASDALSSLSACLLKEKFCISALLRRDVDDAFEVGALVAVAL